MIFFSKCNKTTDWGERKPNYIEQMSTRTNTDILSCIDKKNKSFQVVIVWTVLKKSFHWLSLNLHCGTHMFTSTILMAIVTLDNNKQEHIFIFQGATFFQLFESYSELQNDDIIFTWFRCLHFTSLTSIFLLLGAKFLLCTWITIWAFSAFMTWSHINSK